MIAPTGMCGQTPNPTVSPPSNWQSVFGGPAWTWDARRGQYYMHNFLASQPQLNVALPAVQDALLDAMRFWLDRGVDGFRLDAINFAMHDPALTDNPPSLKPGKRSRPFDFQDHLFNQSQPQIPAFLGRLRQLADSYDGDRFLVAEVVGDRADEEMKLYTRSPDRLQSGLWLSLPLCRPADTGSDRGGAGDMAGRAGRGLAVLGLLQPRCATGVVAVVRGS